ncbi:VIP peptides-like isoform X2 [Leucoraja erinacea]|uniref:VIP peptides-like isoform X2 n=1 Tax=Leucoraja erinaceus TaxID=7782 RepID=UPI002457C55A|nr:VIP peptides-like isoform X2 [Leucoraja erinacea]
MVITFDSHSLTLFVLFGVLWSQGSAVGSDPSSRLGDVVGFDGQSEEDRPQLPLEIDNDIYQSPIVDSEKLYYQLSANLPRTTRHTDGLFTSEYSKMLGQLSARKYLESLIGKRASAQDDDVPSKRHTDSIFTDNFSRIRKKMAVKKYIERLMNIRRSREELNSANLSDTEPLGED